MTEPFVLEAAPNGSIDLVVTGSWSQASRDAIQAGHADGLVLNYARGFQERDLHFLETLPICRLNILSRTLRDISPIYSLARSLTELRVQVDDRASIDLANLPELTSVAATWSQVSQSISTATILRQAVVNGYDQEDLAAFSPNKNLMSLVLSQPSRLRSLDGVENLPWLAELAVHSASALEDISALGRLASPVLRTLRFSRLQHVRDISAVGVCSQIEFFEFSHCGDIESVSALRHLNQIERLHLYETTNVLDGDLEPIASLPKLRDFRMKERSAYRPSVNEIQAAIDKP